MWEILRRFFRWLWYGSRHMAVLGNENISVTGLLASGSNRHVDDGHVAVEDGIIQSITVLTGFDCTQAGYEQRQCLYVGEAADTNTVLANSDTGARLADSAVARDPSGFYCTWNYTGAKPVISAGQTYGLSCTTGTSQPFYTHTGGNGRRYTGLDEDAPLPDPIGTPTDTNTFIIGIYATYIAGSPGGGIVGMLGGVGRLMGG